MSVLAPLPAAAEGLEVWRFPDGSNPLEALFAGPTPIPGITGEITGDQAYRGLFRLQPGHEAEPG